MVNFNKKFGSFSPCLFQINPYALNHACGSNYRFQSSTSKAISILRLKARYFSTLQAISYPQFNFQGNIDYESGAEYKILVKAQNPGTQLSSTGTVLVHVTGVNEYTPVFHVKDYTFTIREDQHSGSSIGGVTATDRDRGDDGIVYYYLVGDSNMQVNTRNSTLDIQLQP